MSKVIIITTVLCNNYSASNTPSNKYDSLNDSTLYPERKLKYRIYEAELCVMCVIDYRKYINSC